MDLLVLGLRSSDVVLGARWLKQLGPILMDYQNLTMKFLHGEYYIELKGDTSTVPTPISFQQLQNLVQLDNAAQFFSLRAFGLDPDPPPPNHLVHSNPEVQRLLHQYSFLFDEPSHLPPSCFADHAITLLPNSASVNVRPYRYPHAQKLEIKAQVAKMLASGWIQPSNNPFSSPIFLLKKKGGTWWMCVNYRALNALTIKYQFLLPTVYELLDELGLAWFFSKLDLTSGFHQIRLLPQDTPKTTLRTHDGHYEYRAMPFSLCNALATFQATMNDIFRPLLRKIVIFFFMISLFTVIISLSI